MGGQFDLRLLAWGLRDFEGNVRMYVRVYCASAALEVPLKQERGVGGGAWTCHFRGAAVMWRWRTGGLTV